MRDVKTWVLAGLIGIGAFLANGAKADVLTVAGGCFWCVEADFEKLPGVRGQQLQP